MIAHCGMPVSRQSRVYTVHYHAAIRLGQCAGKSAPRNSLSSMCDHANAVDDAGAITADKIVWDMYNIPQSVGLKQLLTRFCDVSNVCHHWERAAEKPRSR